MRPSRSAACSASGWPYAVACSSWSQLEVLPGICGRRWQRPAACSSYSPALNRTMPYLVYLPPGYESGARRYPVLYMLHGNSGSYEEWAAYGLIGRADDMIMAGEIQPLIIVLPQGDYSYWVNLVDGGPS